MLWNKAFFDAKHTSKKDFTKGFFLKNPENDLQKHLENLSNEKKLGLIKELTGFSSCTGLLAPYLRFGAPPPGEPNGNQESNSAKIYRHQQQNQAIHSRRVVPKQKR